MMQIIIPEKLFKEIAKAIGIGTNPDNFEVLNLPNIQFIKEEKSMSHLEQYKKGFEDGIGLKEGFKYSILGYDFEYLWKLIIKDKENKEMPTKPTMTRAEAIAKCHGINYPEAFIQALETLGLLKFENQKSFTLCSYESDDLGVIRVEKWPEGLVLWVGGKVKWKSWENEEIKMPMI